jgi:Carboxypeptidase regulatory-like domain/TonB dependent receptor
MRALISTIVACAWLAGSAAAQTTSTITGEVTDQNGGVLPGVAVTVRDQGTGFTRSATTGREGRFIVPSLPAATYQVTAELQGFRTSIINDVRTAVGEPVDLDITLSVASLSDTVTVLADVSPVNTRTSELSYLVTAEAVEQLPLNGRNYTDLALLQPGVLAYPHRDGGSVVAHGLGMSVNGQDPRSNVYLLDGTLLNDMTNGPAGSAAGTALGMETVREFRVETNAYGAEFGRSSGGQISVVTKSGTNEFSGSGYEFHRNDALDARNFFDPVGSKPDFRRNQFGGTVGGPLRTDRAFFFFGYEALREKLGRTISTLVPDDNARSGLLPVAGTLQQFPIHPDVQPFLLEYPRANGPAFGDGTASFTFPFDQRLDQDYIQGRIDYNLGTSQQFFGRYTFDDAGQFLPTDYPQFPRTFLSRNQFFTGEYRRIISDRTLSTSRIGFSRTRFGQNVESNTATALSPFVPGRPLPGNIDVGGLRRFGPQSSANLRLVQNVFSFSHDMVHTRERHLIKFGALAERFQHNMVNPTFSLGTFTFPNLRTFLVNTPTSFIGLGPTGAIDRYWRFTLFGFYAQDEFTISPRLTVNAGLRYEFTTMPVDIYGRDSALPNPLTDRAPVVGQLYENPTYTNLSPRGGFAWDVTGDGRTSVRGGYGLYFNTNSYQNLIVTVTNPPATPRFIISNPTFPQPDFARGVGNSIRPVQYELENPRVHVWNANVQREVWRNGVLTVGYAGSRGRHLLRSGDINTARPTGELNGTPFIAAGTPRPNTAFGVIELKSSDGESWYKALILDMRQRLGDFTLQSSYTLSRSEDTTQASTFFSDATNGTTSAMPEYIPDYNKGPSDFDATHNWVTNFTWDLPFARGMGGAAGAVLDGWRVSGIYTYRSGSPLTVFITANRSRSQWNPSRGPGIGQDRPSWAPGRGPDNAILGTPEQWIDPTAFVVPAAGTFGNTERGALRGPELRTLDLSLTKLVPWARLGGGGTVEFRVEVFNVLNRANLGVPLLTVFAGQADNEQPFASFGRISNTVTSSRQVQLGIRVAF